jgi:hypothetical protein
LNARPNFSWSCRSGVAENGSRKRRARFVELAGQVLIDDLVFRHQQFLKQFLARQEILFDPFAGVVRQFAPADSV